MTGLRCCKAGGTVYRGIPSMFCIIQQVYDMQILSMGVCFQRPCWSWRLVADESHGTYGEAIDSHGIGVGRD